ncbi:MAG TPA: hypothetical protein ENH82_03485 [bacterium]|nr:hypothetical protein [bacterium]
MKPGDFVSCPHCVNGEITVSGFKDGKPATKKKECTHCKGTGELILTLDKRYQKIPGEKIISPPGGIIRGSFN